jgi:hypothetical protein
MDTELTSAARALLREVVATGVDDALVQIQARRTRELSISADGRVDLRNGADCLAAVTSVRGQRRDLRLVSGLAAGPPAPVADDRPGHRAAARRAPRRR